MLDERQQQLIDNQELSDEISYAQDLNRQNTDKVTKHGAWRALSVLFLLLFAVAIVLAIIGLLPEIGAAATQSEDLASVLMWGTFLGVSVVGFFAFLIFTIRGYSDDRRKKIEIVREGFVPELVPEETITVTKSEEIKAPPMKVRHIVDDPSKRVAEVNKRKVERILDPNIVFPNIRQALVESLLSKGFSINEQMANRLVGAFAYSRCFFITGVAEEDRKSFQEGLKLALTGVGPLVEEGSDFLSQFPENVAAYPEGKSTFFGITNIKSKDLSTYFLGAGDLLADYSEDHELNGESFVSQNLFVLVYLEEGDIGGIPGYMLEKCPLLPILYSKIDPSEGTPYTLRATGEEIRFYASRHKGEKYLSESKLECFDKLYDLAKKQNRVLHNDVENAIERETNALLSLGENEDSVSSFILTCDLLPYYLSTFDEKGKEGEGSLDDILSHNFTSEVEDTPIKKLTRDYNASRKAIAEEEEQEAAEAEEELKRKQKIEAAQMAGAAKAKEQSAKEEPVPSEKKPAEETSSEENNEPIAEEKPSAPEAEVKEEPKSMHAEEEKKAPVEESPKPEGDEEEDDPLPSAIKKAKKGGK